MFYDSVQGNDTGGFRQCHHLAARNIGDALSINDGQTLAAVTAVQRDREFWFVLMIQVQRQADLLLAAGLFGGELLRGQCLQCVLQITDLDFRFLAEPCPLLAVLLRGKRIGLAVQRDINAGHIIKIAGEDLLMPQVIVLSALHRRL